MDRVVVSNQRRAWLRRSADLEERLQGADPSPPRTVIQAEAALPQTSTSAPLTASRAPLGPRFVHQLSEAMHQDRRKPYQPSRRVLIGFREEQADFSDREGQHPKVTTSMQ